MLNHYFPISFSGSNDRSVIVKAVYVDLKTLHLNIYAFSGILSLKVRTFCILKRSLKRSHLKMTLMELLKLVSIWNVSCRPILKSSWYNCFLKKLLENFSWILNNKINSNTMHIQSYWGIFWDRAITQENPSLILLLKLYMILLTVNIISD